MSSLQLKLVSFDAVPQHTEALSKIASQRGLSTADFVAYAEQVHSDGAIEVSR
jgi:hypothetical protein